MAKDWDHYKTEIKTLYITNGRSLDDVRRILKGRHNFEASVRAYRMKLEFWGLRKNKVPVGFGSQIRPLRKAKTITIAGPSSGAQSANDATNANFANWPQFDDNEAWPPGFNFPTLNRTSQPIPSSHDNFNTPYIPPNREADLPSGQDLFKIISEGTEEELLENLSSGLSVNIRDNRNNSPLHAAIMTQKSGMAKALLRYGADVDATGFKGKSPLHLSVVSKNLLQLLLKYQPNLSLQDDEGNSILHYLVLLPNWWDDVDICNTIKSVLSVGVDVNIQNRAGESPFHRLIAESIPASSGYMDIALNFLNCKPDVITPMRNGQALLGVFLENTRILQKDTEKWEKPWVKSGFQCLEQFLVAGANRDCTFRSEPLLHYCLKNGSFKEGRESETFLVHLLEEADVDVPGSDGDYPLHKILSRSTPYFLRCKLMPALIARYVDVNKPNRSGASPLELWLTGYRTQPELNKITTLLVEAGASSTITTTTGKTLFDLLDILPYENRENQVFLTKTLLQADIKATQSENDTAAVSEWVQVWRAAWKQSHWSIAKASLIKLEYLDFRPKSEYFMECAFLVISEHFLERHRSRLRLFLEKTLEKGSAMENYDEYCAILRDCRERKADIHVSFYTFLLDIMDF